ncbi:MAG: hypothetical protein K6T57_13710 [Thermaceae bacterium]|nr:hypothetical protein [Thermaceae bacterium]
MLPSLLRWTALLLWLTPALAWSPAPDLDLAQRVVDGVYRRGHPVPTFTQQSLAVSAGAFPPGTEVGLRSGPPSCLSHWLQSPNDYTRFGSRPTQLMLAGQAYQIALAAQTARNAFKLLSAQDALATAQARLPSGHLQVYLEIQGLAQEAGREAYRLGIQTENALLPPYQRAYLEDWEQTPDGRWKGTLIYSFDLTKTNLNPPDKLTLVLQTEATGCVYTLGVSLSGFY